MIQLEEINIQPILHIDYEALRYITSLDESTKVYEEIELQIVALPVCPKLFFSFFTFRAYNNNGN